MTTVVTGVVDHRMYEKLRMLPRLPPLAGLASHAIGLITAAAILPVRDLFQMVRPDTIADFAQMVERLLRRKISIDIGVDDAMDGHCLTIVIPSGIISAPAILTAGCALPA